MNGPPVGGGQLLRRIANGLTGPEERALFAGSAGIIACIERIARIDRADLLKLEWTRELMSTPAARLAGKDACAPGIRVLRLLERSGYFNLQTALGACGGGGRDLRAEQALQLDE